MIEIQNEQQHTVVSADMEAFASHVIDFTLKHLQFNHPYEVGIIFTDNSGIQRYNKQYRNIDRDTDVLSFPMNEFPYGPFKGNQNDFAGEQNPETNDFILGDIILSLEKAQAQALEYNHSNAREVAFLLVHSILHLLGYDHMQKEERTEMRMQEEDILNAMQLTRNDGYSALIKAQTDPQFQRS